MAEEKRLNFIFFNLKFLVCFFFVFAYSQAVGKDFPTQVKEPVNEAIEIRQKTQETADNWADEQIKLKAAYEQSEQAHARLSAENDALNKKVAARQAVVDELELKIASIARISEELLPFLELVYARLADLVKTDVPFLADERHRRIATLRHVLDDPQVAIGEKFRKTFEALSVEAEYGTTVEVYHQKISVDGDANMVSIFRLGRISLFFRTPDGKTCGVFDPVSREWKKLPQKYHRVIIAAMEMGAKRRPVNLLNLPIGKMVAK